MSEYPFPDTNPLARRDDAIAAAWREFRKLEMAYWSLCLPTPAAVKARRDAQIAAAHEQYRRDLRMEREWLEARR